MTLCTKRYGFYSNSSTRNLSQWKRSNRPWAQSYMHAFPPSGKHHFSEAIFYMSAKLKWEFELVAVAICKRNKGSLQGLTRVFICKLKRRADWACLYIWLSRNVNAIIICWEETKHIRSYDEFVTQIVILKILTRSVNMKQ